MTKKSICYCVAATIAALLIVGLTFAQSSQTTAARKSGSIVVMGSAATQSNNAAASNKGAGPREAASGQAAGRQDQYGHASGVTAPQSTQGATQRKSVSVVFMDREGADSQRNSAHATESVSPSNNVNKGENPLYEGSGKSGTNPLYETGKGADSKVDASASSANTPKNGDHANGQETKFKQDFGQVQPSKKQ